MSPRPTSYDATRSPSAENILRTAAGLFAAHGYAATSTRDIAAAVGIKQPTLYKHFASKDDILVALVRLAVHPLADMAERLLNDPAEPDVRMCRWLRAAGTHLADSPHSIGSLLISPQQGNSEAFAAVLRRYGRLEDDLSELVAAGQRAGVFADGTPRSVVRLTLAVFDTLALPETTVEVGELVSYAMGALLTDRTRLPAVLAAAGEDPSL
ncbi:TetR/AcrR family transcriptional regulator [Pseudonocardia sp. TRM90224]|uniref:TetR/AcrR family transcriptional regulator n=1 Tax=Pseudonocardia sp. TRM90224 TaxID=2812678 RepID=UPI001E432A9E|nr:TetR/AcrR family transcriptional regulator [Pseudonocardia sp. TRM90224]